MMSNPNMSLMEFAEKVGSIHLMPWQKSMIEDINRAVNEGVSLKVYMPRRLRYGTIIDEGGDVPVEIWTDRRLRNGLVKTADGFIEEPLTEHISEYTGDGS